MSQNRPKYNQTFKIIYFWFLLFGFSSHSFSVYSLVFSYGARERTWFYSQHPHNDSQLSVTIVPGYPLPSSGLYDHCAHTWYTDINADKPPMYIQYN